MNPIFDSVKVRSFCEMGSGVCHENMLMCWEHGLPFVVELFQLGGQEVGSSGCLFSFVLAVSFLVSEIPED